MENEPSTTYADSANTFNASARDSAETLQSKKPQRFHPSDKNHRQRLLEWCKAVWVPDFKLAILSGNPPYYHDCCCAFSRRTYAKKAGHQSLQTCIVTQIPSFKEVSNHDDFYKWLLKLLQSNLKRGDRCLFPRLNTEHNDEDTLSELEALETIGDLKKRLQETTVSLVKQQETIQHLKKENDQLLHASKNWFIKYQEIQEASGNTGDMEFHTPVKRTNRNFSLLADD